MDPIVIAHAGGSAHAPANTLGAYRQAHGRWDGVWMEFDCQFTSDDQLVAVHDDTLDRTTDRSGFVSELTADELQHVDAGHAFDGWGFEPVPRLADLLTEGRESGWRLVCEIKNIPGQRRFDETGASYAEAITALLDETRFPVDRLVAICFWAPTLVELKTRRPDVACGFLSVAELPGDMGMTADQNAKLCRKRGFEISAPRHTTPDLTAEHIAACNADGLQVHAWTLNDADAVAAGVAKGLNGITSDHPELVFEALG